MHQQASEVIEYMYAVTADEGEAARREMVYSFYGQYFLLLKVMDQSKPSETMTLKQHLEKKPQLAE